MDRLRVFQHNPKDSIIPTTGRQRSVSMVAWFRYRVCIAVAAVAMLSNIAVPFVWRR